MMDLAMLSGKIRIVEKGSSSKPGPALMVQLTNAQKPIKFEPTLASWKTVRKKLVHGRITENVNRLENTVIVVQEISSKFDIVRMEPLINVLMKTWHEPFHVHFPIVQKILVNGKMTVNANLLSLGRIVGKVIICKLESVRMELMTNVLQQILNDRFLVSFQNVQVRIGIKHQTIHILYHYPFISLIFINFLIKFYSKLIVSGLDLVCGHLALSLVVVAWGQQPEQLHNLQCMEGKNVLEATLELRNVQPTHVQVY